MITAIRRRYTLAYKGAYLLKVAGYCSLMNINEQNSFCCFVQQSMLDGTKLTVKLHNVHLRIANDCCHNLQSAKHTQLHERCTNFSHKITRRVALASQMVSIVFQANNILKGLTQPFPAAFLES